MEKRKKTGQDWEGLSFGQWVSLVRSLFVPMSLVGSCIVFLVLQMNRITQVEYSIGRIDQTLERIDQRLDKIDQRLDKIDQRLDKVDQRMDKIDQRMERMEIDLKNTSDLLHADLTWRYFYDEESKKRYTPKYDPFTRKLEFLKVPVDSTKKRVR